MGKWCSAGGVTPSLEPEKIKAGTEIFAHTPIAEGLVSAGASPTIPEMLALFAAASMVAPPPIE